MATPNRPCATKPDNCYRASRKPSPASSQAMWVPRRMKRLRFLLLLGLAAGWIPLHAGTIDTLDSVLERIRVHQPRHFNYRETRYLQLLAEPWQATGDMYLSLQQMVIAQRLPTVVTTVISAGRLLHIDVEQGSRRSLSLERSFAVPGMEPFLRLLYGTTGLAELQREYVIRFDTTGPGWQLQLAPQLPAEHDIIRMQLSGDDGRGPDRLVLERADGDRTEWQLSLLSQGAAAGRELQQALGDLSVQ